MIRSGDQIAGAKKEIIPKTGITEETWHNR